MKEERRTEIEIQIGYDEEKNKININFKEVRNLLVIGTTGGGKSIALNRIIMNLIEKYSEEEIEIVPIDTCTVELSAFYGIPHYVTGVYSDGRILEEIYEKSYNREGDNNIPLFIIIDDVYDIYRQNPNYLKMIEEMMIKTDRSNIHFIIATDTPTEELLTNELKYECRGKLFLTLSPGEEKDFGLKKELTQEEWDYTSQIGNGILKVNDISKKISIDMPTDKEIEKLVEKEKN